MKTDKQSKKSIAKAQAKPKTASQAKKSGEKSVIISFRVPESVYEPFKVPVEKSGVGRSAFFRALFIENKGRVVLSEKQTATEDYSKYLRLVSKVSNNINQIAKTLNRAEKSGKITERQYLTGLNNLNSIMLLLSAKLSGKE